MISSRVVEFSHSHAEAKGLASRQTVVLEANMDIGSCHCQILHYSRK